MLWFNAVKYDRVIDSVFMLPNSITNVDLPAPGDQNSVDRSTVATVIMALKSQKL